MKTLIINGILVVDEKKIIENGAILINHHKIVDIYDNTKDLENLLNDTTIKIIDVKGNYVLPGFIDIHIHGSKGKDLIEGTQVAVDAVAHDAIKNGCTSFVASLGVVSHKEMLTILDAYKEIKQPLKGANFLGIHEEGPYISNEYKALMDETYIRDASLIELDEMIKHSNDMIKIMTVAPERKGMDIFIKEATRRGITIMMGHSNATIEEARVGLENGAKGFTHLYNAMSPHVHREPGCVSAALLYDNSYAELICDGFHVHPEVIKITYKILTSERIVLITDAMMGKGMDDGLYTLCGKNCEKKGTQVRVVDSGRIAGSAIGLDSAVRLIHKLCGCSMNEIVEMACINPSILAQVSKYKGTLSINKDADICILDHNLEVINTIVMGEVVYDKCINNF